ncbi:hypothetical protein HPB50_010466 [Hyalomma asiaticum]|uniref:Uncharacterized protein n=1 Tax=Hyalomma asiaticum TaxID=266040 RepID=A0ACB7SZG9_HYAAI|nr:hypothetical protein HPB50_010466 [Hyalomma asiaticum]
MGRCCVPGCRGNYDSGSKVHVFAFPKDEARKKSWIKAIPRKDFTPSIHSRVCELHFLEADFNTKLSHFNAASGKTVTVDSERTLCILKCIRNNWMNQKNEGTCFYFPEVSLSGILPNGPPRMKAASFEAVRQLYSLEQTSLLKLGYKLSAKAINPTPMERQNVKLVLNVINPFVSNALETRGDSLETTCASSTALFINIITTWWKIVNVKTPSKGRRLNDTLQNPVNSTVDQQLVFLSGMVDWLDAWSSVNMSRGCLTRETHSALRLTCYSLVELSRYCLEELKFKYVLLGKFQTDTLEDRFGRYRQLAGAQYHVSVRQLLESEKKIRLQKLLMLPQPDISSESDTEVSQHNFSVHISNDEISSPKHDMEVVAYIAGYCAHSALKKLPCTFFSSVLVLESRNIDVEANTMIDNLSRGSFRSHVLCTWC